MDEEERYESLELIVKCCQDGEYWFDVISELISGNCEGGGGECITDDEDSDCDDHEHEEILQCTCGLESMGGCVGTLEQCYDSQRISEKWATVQTEDLKDILRLVFPVIFDTTADDTKWYNTSPESRESYERLRKEAYWHDEFNKNKEEE